MPDPIDERAAFLTTPGGARIQVLRPTETVEDVVGVNSEGELIVDARIMPPEWDAPSTHAAFTAFRLAHPEG